MVETSQPPPADPEVLLRSALERIVLLECLTAAQPRNEDTPATLESAALRAEARGADERARSAEAHRDRLFARLLQAGSLQSSLADHAAAEGQEPAPEPTIDLASFIAELRSELAEVQRTQAFTVRRNQELTAELRRVQTQREPRGPMGWAERLQADGLLGRPTATLTELAPDLCLGTPAERLRLAALLRDLDSNDTALRDEACGRIGEFPATLAAPVVAAALGREREPPILGKLVSSAGRLGIRSLLPLVEREASHGDERVRAAALLARLRLTRNGPVEPQTQLLEAAAVDPSPRVRRATALAVALERPKDAIALLARLAEDAESSVRRMAAACASSLSERPDRLLRRLASDDDASVRREALRALRAAPEIAGLPPAERRRELRTAATAGPRQGPPASKGLDPLPAVENDLRSTLRGKTPAELAEALNLSPKAVGLAIDRGLAEARLTRRGSRIFPG